MEEDIFFFEKYFDEYEKLSKMFNLMGNCRNARVILAALYDANGMKDKKEACKRRFCRMRKMTRPSGNMD